MTEPTPVGTDIMHIERGKFEWNFNTIVTGVGLVITVATMLIGGGIIYETLKSTDEKMQDQITGILTHLSQADAADERNDARAESERKDRVKVYQDQLIAVQAQVATIPQISFQATRALEGIADGRTATASLNTKVDNLTENVGKLSSTLAVVVSKLDDLKTSAQKMDYRMLLRQGDDEKREAFDAAPDKVGAKLARQ